MRWLDWADPTLAEEWAGRALALRGPPALARAVLALRAMPDLWAWAGSTYGPGAAGYEEYCRQLGERAPAILEALETWAAARAPEGLREPSARIRPAAAAAVDLGEAAGGALLQARGESLVPWAPHARWSVAARVALGESPTQIAGPPLTRRQASEWVQVSGEWPDPLQWVVAQAAGLDREAAPHVETPAVAAWALQCLGDGRAAPLRARIEHLDTVLDEDLDVGHYRPKAVFDAARVRGCMDGGAGPVHPWSGRTLRCVTPLRTAAELAREGERQSHCAATFASRVSAGELYFYSIRLWYRGERLSSTFSLYGGAKPTVWFPGTLHEHKGPANDEHTPRHPVLNAIVARQMTLWGLRP